MVVVWIRIRAAAYWRYGRAARVATHSMAQLISDRRRGSLPRGWRISRGEESGGRGGRASGRVVWWEDLWGDGLHLAHKYD